MLFENIDLAEHIAVTARGLGIESALIGASAMAIHRFVRATKDIDLGTYVHPFTHLTKLEAALRAEGYHVRLTEPDDQDDLGGVLRVWTRENEDEDPIDPVEVVNFLNPYRGRRGPASDAIREATVMEGRPSLRYVGLASLVALKLDAGGPKDVLDVLELLKQNPEADREAIRATCKRYGLDLIDKVLAT